MTEEYEINVFRALDYIRDQAPAYAKAKSERIFLEEGECWYLNANLPHRVTNNSNRDRIHLVIDCEVNDWLKNMINSSAKIAFKKEEVDDNLLNMIKHLRYQNTEASNKQADALDQKVKDILNAQAT